MPAPSLLEILKVEAAVQNAWRQILINAGISETQVFIEFLAATKVTPRIEINLAQVNSFGPHFSQALPGGIFTYSAWEGHLVSRIATRRNVNGDQHDQLLGICRREASAFLDRFDGSVLPWHAMSMMKEIDTHRLVDSQRDEDLSELTHRVIFCVRENAWPATEI